MGAIFTNFAAGTITDTPLAAAATTVNSAAFALLPTVASPDFIWLVLDPGATAGTPEVVKITAHSAAATVVTVARGQQTTQGGSATRSHNGGTQWVLAATASDMDNLLYRLVTTKGDLVVATGPTAVSRLGIGGDQAFLRADSTQTTGVRWGNAGTVPIHSTTAARDAAMPTPSVGQGMYLRTNDATEGLYFSNTAGGGVTPNYRPPWNMPWGYVASAAATAHNGITGAAIQINGMIVNFTAVGNRRYLLQLTSAFTVGASTAAAAVRIRDSALTSLASALGGGTASFSWSASLQTIQTPAAGAVSYNVSLETSGQPVDVQTGGTYLVVTDIGPSGAPT